MVDGQDVPWVSKFISEKGCVVVRAFIIFAILFHESVGENVVNREWWTVDSGVFSG